MLNIHICPSLEQSFGIKCLHQDNTNALCSCHIEELLQQTRYKLLILPFNDAESNNMNTCILQCTFMSISGRRPGGRGGQAFLQSIYQELWSSSVAPSSQSCDWMTVGGRREQTSECLSVTEVPRLLWALGSSGQWWQQTGRANHSGAPRQWMQARLRYR